MVRRLLSPQKPSQPEDRTIAARWSPRIAASGWMPVPTLLLRYVGALGLTASELVVLLEVLSFRWDSRLPFPTTAALAKRIGVSPRAVRATLRRLDEKGLLAKKRVGRRLEFDPAGLIARLESVNEL